MGKYLPPTSSEKRRRDQAAEERSARQQTQEKAEQAAYEARKKAERSAKPRKKPGPKPKISIQAEEYSSDDANPYDSPVKMRRGPGVQGKRRRRWKKGSGKYKNYWYPPVITEILAAIQKKKSLTGVEKDLKRRQVSLVKHAAWLIL